MYGVRCPHCRTVLKIDRQLTDARLKCRKCGQVFVGSTEPSDAAPGRPQEPTSASGDRPAAPAAPPAPGPPAGPARSRPTPPAAPHQAAPMPRRKPASPLPLIVVCVCGLGVILAAVFTIYNLSHQTIKDQFGNMMGTGSKSDYERLQAEEKQRKEAADKERAERQAAKAGMRTQTPVSPTPEVSAPPAPAGAVSPASKPTMPPPKPIGDRNLPAVIGKTIPNDVGEGGFIVGSVRNNSDKAMESIKITVRLFDKENKVVQSPTVTLDWVPPNTTDVPFMVQYNSLNVDAIETQDVGAAGKPNDTKIGWMIDPADCQMRRDGDVIVLTGRTRNILGQRVNNAKVYCDFYTEEGVYAGAASPPGRLTGDSASVGPNTSVDFEVRFNAATSRRALPDTIRKWAPRLIGDKP